MLRGHWLWLRNVPQWHVPSPSTDLPPALRPLMLFAKGSCFPWISPFPYCVFSTYKPFCCCSVDSYVFLPHPLFPELLFFFLLLLLLLLSSPPPCEEACSWLPHFTPIYSQICVAFTWCFLLWRWQQTESLNKFGFRCFNEKLTGLILASPSKEEH